MERGPKRAQYSREVSSQGGRRADERVCVFLPWAARCAVFGRAVSRARAPRGVSWGVRVRTPLAAQNVLNAAAVIRHFLFHGGRLGCAPYASPGRNFQQYRCQVIPFHEKSDSNHGENRGGRRRSFDAFFVAPTPTPCLATSSRRSAPDMWPRGQLWQQRRLQGKYRPPTATWHGAPSGALLLTAKVDAADGVPGQGGGSPG